MMTSYRRESNLGIVNEGLVRADILKKLSNPAGGSLRFILSPESHMANDMRNATEDDGSEALPDRRREAFARALFEGVEVGVAYERAGFRRPRGNATRMEKEPAIQARVNYLRRELDEADLNMRSVRRHQLRQQLTQIAAIDRLGLFEEVKIKKTIGRGRNRRTITLRRLQLKPLADLTPEQRALVEGVESDGLRPAMRSKLGALAQLAKLDGLDQPSKFSGEVSYQEKHDATDWTREELLAVLNANRRQVEGR
jgi:hypothetical protein